MKGTYTWAPRVLLSTVHTVGTPLWEHKWLHQGPRDPLGDSRWHCTVTQVDTRGPALSPTRVALSCHCMGTHGTALSLGRLSFLVAKQ